MDGREVFKFAVRVMGKASIEALKEVDMELEDIDFF